MASKIGLEEVLVLNVYDPFSGFSQQIKVLGETVNRSFNMYYAANSNSECHKNRKFNKYSNTEKNMSFTSQNMFNINKR